MTLDLSSLNREQLAAVEATEGPCLILAGAGSGKTRALTYRVAYLISEKKISPANIMGMTFTNRPAAEMVERIKQLTDNSASQPVMGTFHSFCARLLRKEGAALGLPPGFAIYDESDALDCVKQAMANLAIPTLKTSPHGVRSTISGAKNELISSLEYPQYARGFYQETVAKIYLEYQKILEKNHALDFDDLLLYVIKLFQKDTTILTKYQIQFRYILIDEYQDTNPAQYLISQYLAKRNKNICVVGDASQSIYSFRGADFRNIVNFQKDYPGTKVFNLEQNYRSTQNILDAAHAIISKNTTHPILKLWTDKNGGEKIEIIEVKNEIEEALFIINHLRGEKMRLHLGGVAVLYRTNAQSRSLEEQFLKSGIPYKLVGGVSFYARKEIKDVLSYLRLMQNPKDSVALKRAEKIGKGRLAKVTELRFVILNDSEGSQDLKPRDSSTSLGMTTLELLDLVLQKTGYLDYLDDKTEEGKGRVENVKELRSVAEQFPDLTEFLENVSLVENNSSNKVTSDAVTLMTLH